MLAAVTKVGEQNRTERFLPVVNGIVKSNHPELQVGTLIIGGHNNGIIHLNFPNKCSNENNL